MLTLNVCTNRAANPHIETAAHMLNNDQSLETNAMAALQTFVACRQTQFASISLHDHF